MGNLKNNAEKRRFGNLKTETQKKVSKGGDKIFRNEIDSKIEEKSKD